LRSSKGRDPPDFLFKIQLIVPLSEVKRVSVF
jgi:hypothetical protein